MSVFPCSVFLQLLKLSKLLFALLQLPCQLLSLLEQLTNFPALVALTLLQVLDFHVFDLFGLDQLATNPPQFPLQLVLSVFQPSNGSALLSQLLL